MKIAFIVDGFPEVSETFILNQIVGLGSVVGQNVRQPPGRGRQGAIKWTRLSCRSFAAMK